jgi:hypothetical protein
MNIALAVKSPPSMLRISGSQLKQWRESVKPNETSQDFIRLPVQDETHHIVNRHPIIELRWLWRDLDPRTLHSRTTTELNQTA